MTNQETKIFTDNIFNLIKKSENIEDLISIEENEFEDKFKMDITSYPKIEFEITPTEIDALISNDFLDCDFNFRADVSSKITDPLTKLLYSLAWKNGDLKKLKHIAKGISEIESNEDNQEKALVFYQFGKYLTKTDGQPIIDQHVIRAFSISKLNDSALIEKFRKLSIITKKEKENISNYIKWLKSDELSDKLKSKKNYSYHIDRILFATGRKTKFK
ncbi:hypothetical protein [Formosa sp. PL04]|uniref:hypothetical protein n=1 Tax=Formosa sp. PL04 TaxID=3081755 RepID=UPI002980FE6D|nr:hypothetical protein [Formosa sp. PL04]MDW5288883.1 hypothetical protein [Formosa sp. PL04]